MATRHEATPCRLSPPPYKGERHGGDTPEKGDKAWSEIGRLRPAKVRTGGRCWAGEIDGQRCYAFKAKGGGLVIKVAPSEPWSGHHGVARQSREGELDLARLAREAMDRDPDPGA